METIPDIIRGFRAADGEVLRIAGADSRGPCSERQP